jgi:hypothetical protein
MDHLLVRSLLAAVASAIARTCFIETSPYSARRFVVIDCVVSGAVMGMEKNIPSNVLGPHRDWIEKRKHVLVLERKLWFSILIWRHGGPLVKHFTGLFSFVVDCDAMCATRRSGERYSRRCHCRRSRRDSKLNYLERESHPDIAYAIHHCARFAITPRK